MAGDGQKGMLLYFNEDVQVMWHKGTSDFLLVTFADAMMHADGSSFFARAPAQKMSISTIGFVGTTANWYPENSVKRAYDAIAHILFDYSERVVYGGSMGGYAAAKYSKLLGATTVLSMCPQWSIDATECGGEDPHYTWHFRSDLAGMGIRPADVEGRVYIFYDPTHKTDSFHADKIAAASRDHSLVHVQMSDHHVTDIMAGSANLVELIELCRASDDDTLRRFIRRVRSGSAMSLQILLNRAMQSHPKLAANASLVRRSPLYHGVEPIERVALPILRSLVLQGYWNEGRSYAQAVQSAVPLTYENRMRLALLLGQTSAVQDCHSYQASRLVTWADTLLVYDVLERRLKHLPVTEVVNLRPEILPILLRRNGTSGMLVVSNGNGDCVSGLMLHASGAATLVPVTDLACRSHLGVTVMPGDAAGGFSLDWDGRYVCAQSDGSVVADRASAAHWEILRVLNMTAQPDIVDLTLSDGSIPIEDMGRLQQIMSEVDRLNDAGQRDQAVARQQSIDPAIGTVLLSETIFENLIYQSLRLQRMSMLALLARDRFGYQAQSATVEPAVGADPSVIRCTISDDRHCHWAFSPTIAEWVRSNPSSLQMIAWHWAHTIPILVAYARSDRPAGMVTINLGDEAHTPGLSFCDRGNDSILLPDPYFMKTRGYADLARKFGEQDRPWPDRRPIALWRGSTTGYRVTGSVLDLPRIRLCCYAQDHSDIIDAGVTSLVQIRDPEEENLIRSMNIMKAYMPVDHFTDCQYQIDIDGNTNSWPGLFSKLLSNSATLKITSADGWRQWYYDRMIPYQHYFPIKSDLSDLAPALYYLRSNPEFAMALAAAGREFALSLTYNGEIERACGSIETAVGRFST